MVYVVQPVLYDMTHRVVRGLAEGSMTRWGGVVRMAKGYPGAGEIVTFLKEIPVGNTALQPANLTTQVLTGARTLSQVNQGLAIVTHLSQVAAAASVLNLGVSVVGFAIIAHKLNRLQDCMTQLSLLVEHGLKDVTNRLDNIQRSLIELRFISLTNTAMLEEALANLAAVRNDLFNDKAARVMSWMDRLRRESQPTDAVLRDAAHAFDETRRWLACSIDSAAITADRCQGLADVMLRYRLWCMTCAGEVAVARRMGEAEWAATLSRDAGLQSRQWARRWAESLAPPQELGGVLRFGWTCFDETVPTEVRTRLYRLQTGQEATSAEEAVHFDEGGRQVAYSLPELPPGWVEQQAACASLLDFAEEATERLEALGDEMAYCQVRRIGYDRWEALPLPEQHEGLALVELTAA